MSDAHLRKLVRQHAQTARLLGVDFVPMYRAWGGEHASSAAVEDAPVGEASEAVGDGADPAPASATITHALDDPIILRCQPAPRINHHHNHVGHVDGRVDLVLDLVGELVRIDKTDPAGVDQLEIMFTFAGNKREPIARHTRPIVDNRQPLARQPIEQARFADVRSAHYHDARDRHSAPAWKESARAILRPATWEL